jgi:hypothetical protein
MASLNSALEKQPSPDRLFVRRGVTVATASFSDKTTTPATGFTYTVRTVDAGGNAILNEIQRR